MLFSLQLIFFTSCAIQYVTLYISSVRKPLQATEKGPKLQHPRSTDPLTLRRRTKSMKGRWRFHPFPSAGVRVGSLSYWVSLQISSQWPSLTTSRDSGSILGLELPVLPVKLVLPPRGHLTLSTLNSCFHVFIT